MKKQLLILLVAVVATLVAKGQDLALSKLDEKNGFKSIILGDSISKYKDFPLIGGEGSSFYDANSVGLSIGDIPLKSVAISVYKGRISRIIVFFTPDDGYKIHGVLKEAYGIYTDRPNRFMDKYNWESKKVKLSLDYDSKYKDGAIIFSSIEVVEQQWADDSQKEKKAVSDL